MENRPFWVDEMFHFSEDISSYESWSLAAAVERHVSRSWEELGMIYQVIPDAFW